MSNPLMKVPFQNSSLEGNEAELFFAPKSASYSENEVKGNARLHPGPLPQEREKHPQCLGTFMLCGAAPPHGDSRRRLPFLNTPCTVADRLLPILLLLFSDPC